ncbi:putative leucine-rich repeat receptor serine/threonine-protein kinase [Trifolium repens]|nr:putative leucine-rich repeat receptor serine/threonine-protein kinase [Trifolium repens]
MSMNFSLLLNILLLAFSLIITSFTSGSILSQQEVQVMKDIGRTLGKNDWDFSKDPCSGESNWTSSVQVKGFENAVTCNCSFVNATLCHIVSIVLKSQNLSGTLPTELVKLPYLQQIDLTNNYLNGTIPPQWGSMINLVNMILKFNQLSGNLPPELGNLHQLERLLLSSNYFTGNIPATYAKLTKLKHIRLCDNQFYGPIPDFIQSWTSLERMVMQGSGLSGPIPSGITYLKNLNDLRISDLKDSDSTFPLLLNLTNLETLVLRSCNLIGSVPEYLGTITNLQSLDLSFNKLSGPIPNTLGGLKNTNLLYLTGNLFTGPLPNWIARPDYTDLSYNNLSIENPEQLTCQQGTVNLFASSSKRSNLGMVSCLGNNSCPKHRYSLRINCGVNLHFAEIMFTDDQTYSSLGRRIFDIYIQGRLVLKDFNIAKEAGGVGKAIIKKFTATVTSNTLEIRLRWAGKGTTGIPFDSVYGPLISAISVDPDFIPPAEKGSSIPVWAIVAVVVSGVLVIFMVFIIAWWRRFRRQIGPLERELKGLEFQPGLFTLRQIKAATNNFDIEFKIGEGGFGSVYKGVLSDSTIVAVKQLSSKSKQGNREFINEIGLISALQHPCLVKLYGCCMEGDQLLLIYEYMENNSLACALFAKEKDQLKLAWSTRKKICIGIARGLAYLHEESRLKIVHRDIKATNVLLDKDLNPKISDFGLAKLKDDGYTHMTTRVAGTYGYMAPEYAMHGYLTDKADVYSFGVVALEIVSGKHNTMNQPKDECFSLVDWVRLLNEEGNIMDLVDERLGEEFKKEEAMIMINVALLCTHVSPTHRPTMSSVVSMLEGKSVVQEVVSDTSQVFEGKKLKMIQQNEKNDTSEIETTEEESILIDSTAEYMSDADLHSTNMDSPYASFNTL